MGPVQDDSNASRLLSGSSRPASSYSSTLDGMKRRSFLPQPGDSKHGSRRVPQADLARQLETLEIVQPSPPADRADSDINHAAHDVVDAVESSRGRSRAQSMRHQASAIGPEVRRDVVVPPATRIQRPLGTAAKPATAHSTGLSRSQSLRKPGAPSQTAQSGTTRSHLRTQSISTNTASEDATVEVRTRRERPRSLFVPQTTSTKVALKEPGDTASSIAARPARSVTLNRSASIRTRKEPAPAPESTELSTRTRAAPTHRAANIAPKTRDAGKEGPKKQPRPAFSTLQQHYTPRKVGKALTSTFLHPSAPEVGPNTISADVASLQAELLQLHLLHEASARTNKEWELSAMENLRDHFNHATNLHKIMRAEEMQGLEERNLRALRDWTSGQTHCSLTEHIQILSGPLQELPSLVDSEGRFGRLIEQFETWIMWADEVSAARLLEAEMNRPSLESVEALGDSWKAENAALTRKLTSYSSDLGRLTQPASGSSIAIVVASCQQLVDGLLNELQIMRKIELDIVAREQTWVEAGLKAIARDVGSLIGDSEDDRAWRL